MHQKHPLGLQLSRLQSGTCGTQRHNNSTRRRNEPLFARRNWQGDPISKYKTQTGDKGFAKFRPIYILVPQIDLKAPMVFQL